MAGFDAMTQMNRDHTAREMQRMKVRAPVILLTTLVGIAAVLAGLLLARAQHPALGIAAGVGGVLLAILLKMSLQLLAEWDRAMVLRFGQFRSVKGRGSSWSSRSWTASCAS